MLEGLKVFFIVQTVTFSTCHEHESFFRIYSNVWIMFICFKINTWMGKLYFMIPFLGSADPDESFWTVFFNFFVLTLFINKILNSIGRFYYHYWFIGHRESTHNLLHTILFFSNNNFKKFFGNVYYQAY